MSASAEKATTMIEERNPHEPDPLEPDGASSGDDERLQRIVQRPDGFHWIAPDGHQEFGPFATLDAVLADMQGPPDDGVEPEETLAEAEQELGLSEWLDPDTGALAEDTGTRIEDH
jgi:hypothetical protein